MSVFNPRWGKQFKSRRNQPRIWFAAPIKKIVSELEKQGFIKRYSHDSDRTIPNAITKFIFLDHKSILLRYNAIIREYLNYYSPADNFFRLNSVISFILRHSCAKTLARKFRLKSRAGAFRNFGKNLSVKITKGEKVKTYQLPIPEEFKSSTRILKDPLTVLNFRLQSQSALDEVCAICGSRKGIEMHHVKHLRKNQAVSSGFTRLMSELNRKQLPVCRPCHRQIHKGCYNGLSLNNLWIKAQKGEDE